MRHLVLAVLAGAGVATVVLPAAAEPVTTRIETRPFYGAVVTMERGVRVFRPLPRHDPHHHQSQQRAGLYRRQRPAPGLRPALTQMRPCGHHPRGRAWRAA